MGSLVESSGSIASVLRAARGEAGAVRMQVVAGQPISASGLVLGGQDGALVVSSSHPSVGKGWRLATVGGSAVGRDAASIKAALDAALRMGRAYTVTFEQGQGSQSAFNAQAMAQAQRARHEADERLRKAEAAANTRREVARQAESSPRPPSGRLRPNQPLRRTSKLLEVADAGARGLTVEDATYAKAGEERLQIERMLRMGSSSNSVTDDSKRSGGTKAAARSDAPTNGSKLSRAGQKHELEEEEEKAREKARRDAEQLARKEAQRNARLVAEARARLAEEKARKDEQERVRKEAEERVRKEAAERARAEATERARRALEERARNEAARRETEEMARAEAAGRTAKQHEAADRGTPGKVAELAMRWRRAALERRETDAADADATEGFGSLPKREEAEEPEAMLLLALAIPTRLRKTKLVCPKCDGEHTEDDCPYFKAKRESHEDAWAALNKAQCCAAEEDNGPEVVDCEVVKQPGDGACLFHSLVYGLGAGSAAALREEVSAFISSQADALLSGTPVHQWVTWDSNLTPEAYADRMRDPKKWGGAIEIAITAMLKKVQVRVYEPAEGQAGRFQRISVFGAPGGEKGKVVHLAYGGRVHYDALVVAPSATQR